MAVLVEKNKIKNLKAVGIKSDNDIKYPDSDAKTFAIGCVSKESLITENIFISFHKMFNCSTSFDSIVYSFPILPLCF